MNTDRVVTVGPLHRRFWEPNSFTRIQQRDSGVALPLFDVDGMSALGFSDRPPAAPSAEEPALTMDERQTSYPIAGPDESYFWSCCAALDDVREVAVCRGEFGMDNDGQTPMTFISGLVLTHANGRQTALGMVRLDRLEAPTSVRRATGFWLRFGQSSRSGRSEGKTVGKSRVVDLMFAKPSDEDGRYDIHVKCRGRLEWWYSSRQYQMCQVQYEGQVSPAPRR